MTRRSLRPHLDEIRGWVKQGRSDAWIALQLDTTVGHVAAVKRDNKLVPPGTQPDRAVVDLGDEIEPRAEDADDVAPIPRNPRLVAVARGRDQDARRAVFQFLRAVGLEPRDWEKLVAQTNSAAPIAAKRFSKDSRRRKRSLCCSRRTTWLKCILIWRTHSRSCRRVPTF